MMKLFKLLMYVVLLLLLNAYGVFAEKGPSVLFLNPGSPGDPFFSEMTSFMIAAADDLNMSLEVVHCNRSHLELRKKGLEILDRERLPQYLLLINEKNGAVDVLEKASAKGVKVILFNEALQPVDKKRLGRPGEILSNWILEYLPNDRQAGYLLAKTLIEKAKSSGLNHRYKSLEMVAIAGNYRTGSSSERISGLKDALKEFPEAVLMQIVPAYWEKERAMDVTRGLLSRYPEVKIVWAASDLMASGAELAAGSENLAMRKKILIGGIDWTDEGLQNVADSKIVATVGGHFLDGGWVIVMLHDYHHGIAFEQVELRSDFSVITEENVEKYRKLFGRKEWSNIDFRRFSKVYNKSIEKYRFDLK